MNINDDIESCLNALFNDTQKRHAENIRREWDGRIDDIPGEAHLSLIENNVGKGARSVTYKAWGQRAWIDEFGSGSLMDKENPYLPAYKSSKYWNKEREDTEIRTRHRQVPGLEFDGHKFGYLDLDDNPHRGSGIGMPHGINIETSTGRFHGAVRPHLPRHTVREEVTGQGSEDVVMTDAFGKAINEFIALRTKEVLGGEH